MRVGLGTRPPCEANGAGRRYRSSSAAESGIEQTFHGFLRLGDSASLAFVQGPEMAAIEPVIGVSHAGFTAGPVAPGTMQHLALNVGSHDDLLAVRDRIRSHGHWVMGPIDHGMCQSIYLAAPEGLMLEFASSAAPIDADEWIDPEVVALCGSIQ